MLTLGDLAKRLGMYDVATEWFTKVNKTMPSLAPGWYQHSKLREEIGDYEASRDLLGEGLKHPELRYNQDLLIKMIRAEERLQNIEGARVSSWV